MTTPPRRPSDTCPDGAGSINNPQNGAIPPGGGISTNLPRPQPANPYVPPELCKGDWQLGQGDAAIEENLWQESLAAENINISGAPINVFKLLGVHEQGRLIDLTGNGEAIASSGAPSNAFDALAPDWTSSETGSQVLSKPAWIGYDLGIRKTSFNQPETLPGAPAAQHITSFRITQPTPLRVRQVRVERSDGGFKVDPAKVQYTGSGNGTLGPFQPGFNARPGLLVLQALSATQFSVLYVNGPTTTIGVATVGVRFNSDLGSFTISAGTVPFSAGDLFTALIELDWYRVDIVNLPDVPVALISVKQSAPSRYWRLVPTMFVGGPTDPWVVSKLELFDYEATRLDNIQDQLLLENRDRDYATSSIQLKASYQIFDGMSDMSKFGFQIADTYTFTLSFAEMVRALGRPIVVGDVIDLPAEVQYDHNLRPVRRFVEVTDASWSAEGFTAGWKPVLYRFTAQHLIPGQEHRDIFGTIDTQKYVVDDGTFFAGIQQLQTAPLTSTEANQAEAIQAVPEKGTNVREVASGTNRFKAPGTYDGTGPYVEDGLPPDGQPYTEGFKLPDVGTATDGQFFRLNYDPQLNIPARLYKFSSVKNKWIYVETDRRTQRSAHRPSQQAIFELDNKRSLVDKL